MQLDEIATKKDITVILTAIEKLDKTLRDKESKTDFLRSADVRKMLKISASTLQRLRISQVLKAKKLNGTWFYKLSDINQLMNYERK